MTTVYKRKGESFNHVVAAGGDAVASNDVVIDGAFAGVAVTNIAPGESGTVAIDGVFQLPARTGVAFVRGEPLAWDESTGRVIKSSAAVAGDIDGFGKAMDAKASAATTVDVLLTPATQTLHA